MRVAILSPFQLRMKRGIERVHWSLAKEFAARGVEVDILSWAHPYPVEWGTPTPGVQVLKVPYIRYFMGHWASLIYRTWLRRKHYDWVIVAFAGYGETAVLQQGMKSQICMILHYPIEQVPHRYREFRDTGLAARAALRIGVSQHTARGAEDFFGRQCRVISNGVDTKLFQPSGVLRTEMRERLGLSAQSPVLVTTAALEERKGIQHVIRSVAALSNLLPDLHYWVLGEGPYRPELERIIRELALVDRVHLPGVVNDVVPYLSMADSGCLISFGEAFPLTPIECMAMALPCITSQHPPFDEIIEPAFGIMVDETHSTALTDTLYDLLTDKLRRVQMGIAGRAHAITHYDWGSISEVYLRLMSEAESN